MPCHKTGLTPGNQNNHHGKGTLLDSTFQMGRFSCSGGNFRWERFDIPN
jgi:hypothetical protein